MTPTLQASSKQILDQQRMLASVFAAARGVAPLKLNGDAPVFDKDLQNISYARQGLEAVVAKTQTQEPAAPKSSLPHIDHGLAGWRRGATGLGVDLVGQGLAFAFGGPIGAAAYTGFAAMRYGHMAVRSAGAMPARMPHQKQAAAGVVSNPAGKGSHVMGVNGGHQAAQYQSFADQADQARAVRAGQTAAAKPGHADVLAARSGLNFNAIHINEKQAAAAHQLLASTRKQEANVVRLLNNPVMNPLAKGVVAERQMDGLSFADELDMARGGKISLRESGTVSSDAIKRFTQRHHAPSAAQQMALKFG